MCQKWELFFVEPEVKVNEQYWLDILISQLMLAVIKHVYDSITDICLSATQLMHAPAHGSRSTDQQLLCKTLNFISPELWPKQARAELSWLQDLGGLQQREYELQVNKIEIKQWLIELWKSSNATFEWKYAIIVFLCFAR